MPLADKSSKAYIARIKGGNIISAILKGLKGGIGYQLSLLEAKIASVIETPPQSSIPAPSNLDGTINNNSMTILTWKNNATGIIDTLIEIFEIGGTDFVPITHDVLGSAETFTYPFNNAGVVRVSSITANGISGPSNLLSVVGGA
jgi:hypothetical protein